MKEVRINLKPLMAIICILGLLYYYDQSKKQIKVDTHRFETMILNGDVEKLTLITNMRYVEIIPTKEALTKPEYLADVQTTTKSIFPNNTPYYLYYIPSSEIFNSNYKDLIANIPPEKRVYYDVSERFDIGSFFINWGGMFLLFFLLWAFSNRLSGVGGGGSGLFSIGKSKAKLFDKDHKVTIKFDDVAGLHEAKQEVEEIVDFLRNPQKYDNLGAKVPKGVLLVGQPGTGKTLLAKAVAGEANVSFFSLSGADFVEMFVGVGVARVKDLFQQAKLKAPAIIFIDEIDAIGRARKRNNYYSTGGEEHENTLNALLVEMDGFEDNSGIVVMAATNRVEILDQALLRPGRFDRQIAIDNPDIKDRKSILELYIKKIKADDNLDVGLIAEQTPGFTGADLAHVCNEAAILAARHNREKVIFADFQEAMDRTVAGLEKKNKLITQEDKKSVAYHEAGHALVSWLLEFASPLLKVTIIPHGEAALGYAQYLPKEKYITPKEELWDEICTLLGGRVSEELFIGTISTGATNDLSRATKIIYEMVAFFGMNEKIGYLSYAENDDTFVKPYSEATSQLIDEEARNFVKKAYERTKNILIENKDKLILLAEELFKREVLYKKEVEEILGIPPKSQPTTVNDGTTTEHNKENFLTACFL